jgi:hypothetical protein
MFAFPALPLCLTDIPSRSATFGLMDSGISERKLSKLVRLSLALPLHLSLQTIDGLIFKRPNDRLPMVSVPEWEDSRLRWPGQ